jgi:OPA family glycerol-3-phosphate transporter-like MFS transporter
LAAKPPPSPASLLTEVPPILILIAVIAFVVWRLPRTHVSHSPAYRWRRAINWLPLGLTYAFLYMARYNLTVLKNFGAYGGMSQDAFGKIDGIGAITYGLAFLLNGPLTDRWGGRVTILISAAGAAVANVVFGVLWMDGVRSTTTLAVVFAINMYFQSFGAVSIVKVNARWFHVRERGTFGGIFGILISLGIYFALDWGTRIAQLADGAYEWMFFVPAVILVVFFALCVVFVRDRPSDAGFEDFELGDASSARTETAFAVIKRLMTNPIIVMIACIELCSGFLRQAITKWYPDFARAAGAGESLVVHHWGMVLCIAGITGGMFAGLISDHVFGSRRAPVSAVLYAIMLVGAVAIVPLLGQPETIGWVIAFMAMAIIGVHGMLSGTASADFGGFKNAGIAVGLIDGFVYLGTAVQDFVYGSALPEKNTPAASDISNWYAWPEAMIAPAVIGLVLAILLWNARPQKATGAVKIVPAPAELPQARVVANE